jgi:glutathione S-transferase
MRGGFSSRSSTRRSRSTRKVLSFAAGDTAQAGFPRPPIRGIACRSSVDGDFVLYESNAIVEYLDEAYPGRGAPLFPGDARQRALIRRLIAEADNYFDKATDPVVDEAFSKKPEERDTGQARRRRAGLREEFELFTRLDTR